MPKDNKATRWSITAFEEQYPLLDNPDPTFVKLLKWQDEIAPETGRKHRQGALQTQKAERFSAVRKRFPGCHIEPATNWSALLAYCSKDESADPDGQRVQREFPDKRPPRVDELLLLFASTLLFLEEVEPKSSIHMLPPEEQYWPLARIILREKPILASIIGQPLPQNLWKHTRGVWRDHAMVPAKEEDSNSITESSPESAAEDEDMFMV